MNPSQPVLNIASTHLRLKPDGHAEKLPVGPEFWPDVMAGRLGSFHHEYLVTTFTFDEDWASWEMHPNGDEIVVLLSGVVDFILDVPGDQQTVSIRQPGDYAFVPQGTWHTANVLEKSMMLFITAGEGTEGKPR